MDTHNLFIFIAAVRRTGFEDSSMKTRNVENGLALVGALLILVAVAFAATSAFDNRLDIEFPLHDHTSTLVAHSNQ